MQYKYKKTIVLFTMMIAIYFAIIFVISNIKENDFDSTMQNDTVTSTIATEEIYTPEDYIAFAKSVNSGNNYQGCDVNLQSDLDFSGYDLIPIGTAGEEGASFLGTFNGNGHTISGVTMERPDNYAGLFVNLGGIVKNLQITNSVFSGQVCGVVASDTETSGILNCYVDVQVFGEAAGAIAGTLNGKLRNCVTSSENFVGEIQEGQIDHCYQIDHAEFEELNQNLVHISGYYENTDFCCWENGCLSQKKADLLETLIARLNIGGVEMKICGYYSRSRQCWCVTLPATYSSEELFLEAGTCQDGYQSFFRNDAEETMLFTWEDRVYPIDFLSADNVASIYVTLQKQKDLDYVHKNKTEEIPGVLTVIDTEGKTSYAEIKGFYGHGNDSWAADKKSYNLKLESYTDLLNMGANDDFVFLAGYRNGSLMSYVATAELTRELGYAYAPEFRLVNLYVDGEYAGVYFLTEKIEIDKNRIQIESVYENVKIESTERLDRLAYGSWRDEGSGAERFYYQAGENPSDITGGYLLEADDMDYEENDSRFVSDRGLHLTLKRARYSSKEQVDYIADYWQAFEDALFAEDGYNEIGKHYSEYIDMESFAMQWLYYEMAEEISLSSSIYFYKESDVTGDGLLHACFPWDVEHSYVQKRLTKELRLVERTAFQGYWKEIYRHKDFQKELGRVWNEKYVPAIQKMTDDEAKEYENGLKSLKWYQENIVGIHQLENSRWENMFPWNRCGEIREFLGFRMDALLQHLKEE